MRNNSITRPRRYNRFGERTDLWMTNNMGNHSQLKKIKEAFKLMTQASEQTHNGHWDMEGTRGLNCPECNRANRLREEAQKLFKEAIEED